MPSGSRTAGLLGNGDSLPGGRGPPPPPNCGCGSSWERVGDRVACRYGAGVPTLADSRHVYVSAPGDAVRATDHDGQV
ncbi:hypothetical protein [Streptomyces resistomycificus]|uniref:hypothetical protein n=1 Tax=Streptomyces resistomycificus TaxID=67356 RepID=UPI000A775F46|nr:hypothetical protein [Streptomyces resistomycificus]